MKPWKILYVDGCFKTIYTMTTNPCRKVNVPQSSSWNQLVVLVFWYQGAREIGWISLRSCVCSTRNNLGLGIYAWKFRVSCRMEPILTVYLLMKEMKLRESFCMWMDASRLYTPWRLRHANRWIEQKIILGFFWLLWFVGDRGIGGQLW